MSLIIYGANLSPFVRKVRVLLGEKNVPYTLEQVNPFAPPPWFIEISPLKRIPVLRDTDLPEPNTLADSSVICDYLERKYPSPALYPADPFQRARALWYEEYADTSLAEAVGRGLFFERVVKKLLRQAPDESICAAAMTNKIPPVFDYLEKELAGRDYLVGNAFSIADIAVGTMLVNFEHAGETPDPARWPNLAGYMARIHARPSFAACLGEERPAVTQIRAA
ncbi:MAG: glutathione S-transferase family protein [Alphaproteobacteria bacterium]|nr:glutathione S-transferase family protein [Alphaproteobacteria bacterium]MDE2014418.1 glutathione S-transferase family protein [Alphaproteobacteria bacterium]MDE2074877.1 glutathione S-transferase family protein [Alphaproteobacteria bacterium]MDE2353172.1 glutathione S-transferase family protein [Alphaproteobacteria bacterium]